MKYLAIMMFFLIFLNTASSDTLVFRLQQAINKEKEKRLQRFLEDVIRDEMIRRDLLKREIDARSAKQKKRHLVI
ncbi:unnamed protein product [Auanema sp. JU1783]|nr:unnamed protein product [Auanema sp. JU1783]